MSIGSAQPEIAGRAAQAEAGPEPDQEVAGGAGVSYSAAAGMGPQHHCIGEVLAEGEDPSADKNAPPPVIHPARPLPHLPLMREV